MEHHPASLAYRLAYCRRQMGLNYSSPEYYEFWHDQALNLACALLSPTN